MDLSKDASDFLHHHQSLEFVCSNGQGNDPSKLADLHRNLYLHLIQASKCETSNHGKRQRSREFLSPLVSESDKYLDKYADIVDKMDGSGLNNFADGALALCSYHKNESEKWKTSLSVDKILQMSCLQSALVEDGVTTEDSVITLRSSEDNSFMEKNSEPAIKNPSQPASFVGNTRQDQRLPQPPSHPFQKRQTNMTNGNASTHPNLAPPSFHDTNNPARRGWQQPLPTETVNYGYGSKAAASGVAGFSGVDDHRPVQHNFSHPQPNNPGNRGVFQNQIRNQPQDAQRNSRGYNSYGAHRGKKRGKPWMRRNEEEDESEDEEDENDSRNRQGPFRTAKQQLAINQQKKYGGSGQADRSQVSGANYGGVKKSLGTRRGPASKFVPPVLNRESGQDDNFAGGSTVNTRHRQDNDVDDPDNPVDERLRGIDPKMIELINNEIMDHGAHITWSDIAGLDFAKKTIQEIVVWPMLRPDIFTGLRGPPKGLLLFGPPGTGKTLIGKCIASQSKSTFFCISASSLTSKWVGEGEKMVRALFAVARCHQPAVVFIDEIDSLLSQRSDTEHESSRRIKTEFLVQLDGAATESEDRILVIGATNRPQEIDEAARRRFVKRLLIPLPEAVARRQIVTNLMAQQRSDLSDVDIEAICDKTQGYSGADMTNLCREAALGPIRSIPFEMMETITPDQVRPILYKDFEEALLQVRASVSNKDLELYTEWNKTYGSFGC